MRARRLKVRRKKKWFIKTVKTFFFFFPLPKILELLVKVIERENSYQTHSCRTVFKFLIIIAENRKRKLPNIAL